MCAVTFKDVKINNKKQQKTRNYPVQNKTMCSSISVSIKKVTSDITLEKKPKINK